GLSDSQVAERAGIDADRVRCLRDGQVDEEALAAVAPVLNLDAASLLKLARNQWRPEDVEEVDGLAQFNTTYGDVTVNAYLAWDPASRAGVAFDTGADCREMLTLARDKGLKIQL